MRSRSRIWEPSLTLPFSQMTEASPGTHQLTPDHEHHDGSVGQLYPDMECRLVNDDGVDVGDEEEGEIVSGLAKPFCCRRR